jgi:hypothetical protein
VERQKLKRGVRRHWNTPAFWELDRRGLMTGLTKSKLLNAIMTAIINLQAKGITVPHPKRDQKRSKALLLDYVTVNWTYLVIPGANFIEALGG